MVPNSIPAKGSSVEAAMVTWDDDGATKTEPKKPKRSRSEIFSVFRKI